MSWLASAVVGLPLSQPSPRYHAHSDWPRASLWSAYLSAPSTEPRQNPPPPGFTRGSDQYSVPLILPTFCLHPIPTVIPPLSGQLHLAAARGRPAAQHAQTNGAVPVDGYLHRYCGWRLVTGQQIWHRMKSAIMAEHLPHRSAPTRAYLQARFPVSPAINLPAVSPPPLPQCVGNSSPPDAAPDVTDAAK